MTNDLLDIAKNVVKDIATQEMKHFDALPAPIREIVRNAPMSIDAERLNKQVLRLRARGISVADITTSFRNQVQQLSLQKA